MDWKISLQGIKKLDTNLNGKVFFITNFIVDLNLDNLKWNPLPFQIKVLEKKSRKKRV
jgi:hypothetical protein